MYDKFSVIYKKKCICRTDGLWWIYVLMCFLCVRTSPDAPFLLLHISLNWFDPRAWDNSAVV